MRNLEDLVNYFDTLENTLVRKTIREFIVDLTLELLNGVEVNLDESITVFEELKLSENISIDIEYEANCQFTFDCGRFESVEDIGCFVQKVEIVLFDNSVFDLTDDLKDFISNTIMADLK